MLKVCPDLLQPCNLGFDFSENSQVAKRGFEKPPLGPAPPPSHPTSQGGTCTRPRPPPLVLAGGTLQFCLHPALCPDGLDPDSPPGLPDGDSDLPCGYSSMRRWATPSYSKPHSSTSPLMASRGMTQIRNICKDLRKGWRVGVRWEQYVHSYEDIIVRRDMTPSVHFTLWCWAKAVSSWCQMLLWRGCDKKKTRASALGKV